jgi:small-conductance mechanosensitive channel
MPAINYRILSSLVLLLWCGLTLAQEAKTEQAVSPATVSESPAAPATEMERLTLLREQLQNNRTEMETLREELGKTKNEERIAHIQQRLAELPKSIEALNRSFEQIALGGIDMSAFTEQTVEKFNWQDELIDITRPLFGSLKNLTEKPRKIEQLRQHIERSEQQLEVTRKAITSLDALRDASPPKNVALKLGDLAENWQQRQKDLTAELNLAHYQIATLQGEAGSTWDAFTQSLLSFFKGRGLTLLIAAVALIAVGVISRLLMRLSNRSRPATEGKTSRRYKTRQRVIGYIYRMLTVIAMIITLLTVFYARSDLVLLALTVIVVVVVGLTLRQTLPKYIKEIRTLLDFGSVREGERIIYNGLPLEVSSINAFTILRNPELEGIIRLPLAALVDQVSRPASSEEWFPCDIGDFLMFPDGRMAEVMRLTLERVELRMMRSMVQFPTTDFLAMEFRNLSRNGFAIPTTFGIDYQHQAICLSEVPQKMQTAVEEAMQGSDWAPHFAELLVEFKEAGASSLDYLVYVSMRSPAAGSYFNIGRLVQRTLVELCNREGWVIPFAQLTVHQGEGFDSLRTSG